MAKFRIAHNLDEIELEEALEKALKGLRKSIEEPNRALPDALANAIREEANSNFNALMDNMLSEIRDVLGKEG